MFPRSVASFGIFLWLVGCGSGSGPDLALLPLEVVAGNLHTLALADSLRLALACRLEQRGIRVALAVDALPSESLGSPERVGRRLGAEWVLSGSVFAERESLRVVLHLTQVSDDRGAWVRSFLGAITTRDTLSEEMTRAVSSRIPAANAKDPEKRARPIECNDARPSPH